MEQVWWEFALWMALALGAGLIAQRLRVSVALAELVVGIAAGNTIHPEVTPWVTFLAGLGALVLTFLAGAELETEALEKHWKAALAIGFASFLFPFLLCAGLARLSGWQPQASLVAGIALSTTSVAVVYAVMLESGLNQTPLGKLILAACFVTDLGTVVALGLAFTHFDAWFWGFLAACVVALPLLRWLWPRFLAWVGTHISEPEVKGLFLLLAALGYLALKGGSEAVLPAYLLGMVLADTMLRYRPLTSRLRATTFALLTPFYFLKAGSLVDLRAVAAGIVAVLLFFAAKVGAKFLGVAPVARLCGFPLRVNAYTTLMMSTGLTFGSISALYGLNHGIIDRAQYSILVTVVILTAIVPTIVAQRLFSPSEAEARMEEKSSGTPHVPGNGGA